MAVGKAADRLGLDVLHACAMVALGDAQRAAAEAVDATQAAQGALLEANRRREKRRAQVFEVERQRGAGEPSAEWRSRRRLLELALSDCDERVARAGARLAAAQAELRRADVWLQDEIATWKADLKDDPWQPGLSPAARTELNAEGVAFVTWTVAEWRRMQWYAQHPEEIRW